MNWAVADKLFLSGVISKAIYKSSEEDKKEEEVKKTLEQHDNIVTHYKKVIREQVRSSHTVHVPPEVGGPAFRSTTVQFSHCSKMDNKGSGNAEALLKTLKASLGSPEC